MCNVFCIRYPPSQYTRNIFIRNVVLYLRYRYIYLSIYKKVYRNYPLYFVLKIIYPTNANKHTHVVYIESISKKCDVYFKFLFGNTNNMLRRCFCIYTYIVYIKRVGGVIGGVTEVTTHQSIVLTLASQHTTLPLDIVTVVASRIAAHRYQPIQYKCDDTTTTHTRTIK